PFCPSVRDVTATGGGGSGTFLAQPNTIIPHAITIPAVRSPLMNPPLRRARLCPCPRRRSSAARVELADLPLLQRLDGRDSATRGGRRALVRTDVERRQEVLVRGRRLPRMEQGLARGHLRVGRAGAVREVAHVPARDDEGGLIVAALEEPAREDEGPLRGEGAARRPRRDLEVLDRRFLHAPAIDRVRDARGPLGLPACRNLRDVGIVWRARADR